MSKILVSLALTASLGSSFDAAACSIMPEPPNQKFESSHTVILAIPQGNSIKPRQAAERRYEGPLQQTVLWQVLVTWKGKYRPGDEFTTRQNLDVSPGNCESPMRFRGEDARLLYLFDREPYAEFYALPPMLAIDDLKYLGERHSNSGDGP